MTAHSVNCLLSLWSFAWLLGLYHAPPSWRDFDLEFRNPANKIFSLFTYKILLGMICEINLCSVSFGSSKGEFLDTSHVWKEYLGTKELVDENPLRRWEPLGGIWVSSHNFFVQDVKYLYLLGNEKDKEEEHLGGAVCSPARVNMIVFAV